MAENTLLFNASIILFAVISWAVYKYVLTANNNNNATTAATGPEPSSSTTATATATATATGGATTSTNNTTNATAAATNNNNSTKEESSSSPYNNFDQPKRHPPHLYNPSNKVLHPSKVENGGIIPFKLTFASGYETRLTNNNGGGKEHNQNDNLIMTNRKQRARLFAKLFTIADRPPNRGSNVVVIISYGRSAGSAVAKCDKLQKSLMLLGTYYNLFLLVDYSQHQQEKKEKEEELDRDVVKQFRNDLLNVTKNNDDESSLASLPTTVTAAADKLNPQILPPHRIIFTTTPEGKIAFVRQLHEAKLVLLGSSSNNKEEEEEEDNNNNKVKVELERFGFRVVSYPEGSNGTGDEGVSALGHFLIP